MGADASALGDLWVEGVNASELGIDLPRRVEYADQHDAIELKLVAAAG